MKNNIFIHKFKYNIKYYIKGVFLIFVYWAHGDYSVIKEFVPFILKYGLRQYCYTFMNENFITEDDIFLDEKNGLLYCYYDGKRMYLKRSYQDKKDAANYVDTLAREQIEGSPHCYRDSIFDYNIKNGTVFDIGCAEGNFGLSIIDDIDKLFLFECDAEWLEALRYTFEPYWDKVEIVNKYITSYTNDDETTVDDFCKMNNIDKIEMLKMDIEGAEYEAICGCKDLIQCRKLDNILVCVYHNYEDENRIRGYINNLMDNKMITNGRRMAWKIWNKIWDFDNKLFTHGVMHIKF